MLMLFNMSVIKFVKRLIQFYSTQSLYLSCRWNLTLTRFHCAFVWTWLSVIASGFIEKWRVLLEKKELVNCHSQQELTWISVEWCYIIIYILY